MTIKIKQLLAIFYIFVSISSYSQSFDENYSPLKNYSIRYKSPSLLATISKSYDSLISTFSNEEKENKKIMAGEIKALKESILFKDSFKNSMYSDSMTAYFNSIVNRIKKNNPSLENRRITLMLDRSGLANASNYSAGVVYVNLGLITGLKSESEIAFIICHEIAHDLLGHVVKKIKKRTELNLSPKFKAKIKKLQQQEYNTLYAAIDLMLEQTAKINSHSRIHELEADSLGLRLYLNAQYPPFEAVNCILSLDSVDQPKYSKFIDLKSFFETPDFAFDSSLLDVKDYVNLGEGNIKYEPVEDELKTHPDCIDRGIQLLSMLESGDTSAGFMSANEKFLSSKIQAEFELIEMLYNNERYGYALFNTIQLLDKFPSNIYLKAMVVNCLFEIQEAQIKHSFSSVVDFTDKDFAANYNRFLIFLHNLNSNKTRKFLNAYYQSHVKNLEHNEFTDYIGYLVKSLDQTPLENLQIPIDYKKKYPDSRFNKKLNDRFTKKIKAKK